MHFGREHAGRKRVAVVAGEQVRERATVGNADVAFVRQIAQRLFGIVERVLRALFERVAGILFQVGRLQQRGPSERVVLSHEHVDARVEQGEVRHVGIVERLEQHAPVERVGVEHAYLAAERAHVVDDLARGPLAQHEFVFVALARFDDVDECLHAEGIVLGGHGQALARRAAVCIARLQHIRLLDDLAGIAQQLGAVVRERHAAVAAREHGDAQLLFEILDGGGQVGLRRVQVLGRRVDGSVFRYRDEVAQLLQGHGRFAVL